ncbi:MAG: sensor histidine kinase [Aquabacterium sp.]
MTGMPGGSSLRRTLMVGIGLPVLLFVVFDTASLYRQTLAAADTAYDRTLLATAKSIGELLDVEPADGQPRLTASLTYAALEPFEADNRSRLYYRVIGFNGEMVSGFGDMPPPRPDDSRRGPYAALVHFYEDHYRGEPVRMAVLQQPVASLHGQGMAVIQVAETLELRRVLAQQILRDTLWRQAALVVALALVVAWVIRRATRPVLQLSQAMHARAENDLTPLPADSAPAEMRPLLEATNQLMQRLSDLLAHQKRFIRDTSHQLRTPLAVLKTQVQSARRGDLPAPQALADIEGTVDRATLLANQMLALAKVEQLRQQGNPQPMDLAAVVRGVALDVAPLAAQRGLDFGIETAATVVQGHEWGLRELARNLLHNAIRASRPSGLLNVDVRPVDGQARLTVADAGPGIADDRRKDLFQPFAASSSTGGSGLGLAICQEIVASLGGRIELNNRSGPEGIAGLDAVVWLPLAENPSL